MKRNYTVVITDTIERKYYIEDANSPEEAESIAEGLNDDFYIDSEYDAPAEIIDSQITDIIPDEEEII